MLVVVSIANLAVLFNLRCFLKSHALKNHVLKSHVTKSYYTIVVFIIHKGLLGNHLCH